MTNLFKKFFIATLSFMMMFACAFTFTTNKASADTWSLADFARAIARNIIEQNETDLGNGLNGQYYRSIMIIDGRLLGDDDSTSEFLSAFTDELNILINEEETGMVGNYSDLLNSIGLELIVHVSGTSYMRFTTSQTLNITTANAFLNQTRSFRNNDTGILAASYWTIPSNMLTLLEGLENRLSMPIFIMSSSVEAVGHESLSFLVYIGNGQFAAA